MTSFSKITSALLALLQGGMLPPFRPENSTGEYISETGFYQSIALNNQEPIIETRSKYQDISVVESDYYGKILVLDGVVQLTELDANSYNEMMAHPAMFSHPSPKRVLVIGGGDGYVLSEVLKHDSVTHVDHVDLDGGVIEVCREHFAWGEAWKDPRVKLHLKDGAEFLRNAQNNFYDVIIQDSSDPFTWGDDGEKVELPSNVLYTHEHFGNIHRVLSKGGVFSFQAETFNIASDLDGIVDWRSQALSVGFQSSRYGSITISSYPTGQIGFLLCEKKPGSAPSLDEIEERFNAMQITGSETSYYQPKLQQSAFDLPLWVEKTIYNDPVATTSKHGDL